MKKLFFALFALVCLVSCSSPLAPQEDLWVEYTSGYAYVIIHKASCQIAGRNTHGHDMHTTDCAAVHKAFEVDLNGNAAPCWICKPCQ